MMKCDHLMQGGPGRVLKSQYSAAFRCHSALQKPGNEPLISSCGLDLGTPGLMFPHVFHLKILLAFRGVRAKISGNSISTETLSQIRTI